MTTPPPISPAPSAEEVLQTIREYLAVTRLAEKGCTCPTCIAINRRTAHYKWLAAALPGIMADAERWREFTRGMTGTEGGTIIGSRNALPLTGERP